ncbi:3310_t:CDS:2 [Gigaspora margarita]|uniref:3310_t:CDS:1 n=1 Tax=Gigaspora margarita TaxID=4874 RepID=A0ABN7UY05_GIGMA|nr:3310_t:CDS:2 [Gigaspora margarita]
MSLQNTPVILSKASKRNLRKKDLHATKKAKIEKPVSSITNEVDSISDKRENIFYNPLKRAHQQQVKAGKVCLEQTTISKALCRNSKDKQITASVLTDKMLEKGVNIKGYHHIFDSQCFKNALGETMVNLYTFQSSGDPDNPDSEIDIGMNKKKLGASKKRTIRNKKRPKTSKSGSQSQKVKNSRRVLQALINLQYRYINETPEMWYSCIRYPFRTLLENNPKYFSKNGFIYMTERSRDGNLRNHLKKCIAERHLTYSKPVGRNVKNGGVPSRKSVSSLSSDEIEKIYQAYWIMYSKGLAHYSYDYSHEVWNMVRNDGTSDEKRFLNITPRDIKIPDDRYVWYIDRKILAKDIPAYHQNGLYNHYTPYKWAEKKRDQLRE